MTEHLTFVGETTVGRRMFVVERVPSESGASVVSPRWSYRTRGHLGEAIQLDAGACDGVDETEEMVRSRVVCAFDAYMQHRPARLFTSRLL